MTAPRRKTAAAAVRPFPVAGDFVVIGHGIWSEPDNWWIAQAEWSDGEQFLVRDNQGWNPSHAPYLGASDSLMAVGTKEQCVEVLRAARSARAEHREAFQDAAVALQAVKDRCVEEVIAVVAGLRGGLQASGRIS